jgi:small-conductance mechanosensitive channel
MDRFADPSLWIEAGAILVVGALTLMLIMRATAYLARQANFTPLALGPVRFLIRWAVILVIAGLLLNKLFAIDLMSIIVGGLAFVAIGVVAVWSMLSHTTATMLLILLKPFRIFDWINFPGEEVGGKVTDLNLFFTLLDNEEGEHFIIPNNVFFQKTFRHVPGKSKERIELHEQFQRKEPAKEE